MTSLREAKGLRPENRTNGPNKSKIIERRRGYPINSFFHHYCFEPKVLPARKRALHLATYNLPKISSSLIQSKILSAVLVKVQSENILNSKRKGMAL